VIVLIAVLACTVLGLASGGMQNEIKLLTNCYATNTKGVTSVKQLVLPSPLDRFPKVTGANAVCFATVGVGFFNCTESIGGGETDTRAECKLKELFMTDDFNDKYCDLPGIGSNSTYCSKMKSYTETLRTGLGVGIVSAVFCAIGILFSAWGFICLVYAGYRFCNLSSCMCVKCTPPLTTAEARKRALLSLVSTGASNGWVIPFAMISSMLAFAAAGAVSSASFTGILPDTSTLKQGSTSQGIVAGVLLTICIFVAVFIPFYLTSKRCTADLMEDATADVMPPPAAVVPAPAAQPTPAKPPTAAHDQENPYINPVHR
jgi:hypothetical protein